MIETPFTFEENLTAEEFQKIGQLSLRWSHTDHIIGNCLKVMLRLSDEEAVLIVFPMGAETRLTRIAELAAINPLNPEARSAFDELKPIMTGIQFVRNNVIHAIIIDDMENGQQFHLRSKQRSLTKEQVFSTEEITNYAARAAISFRYALGMKTGFGGQHPLPDRPAIPEFLRSKIQFPEKL
jgi:hypothetical protein